MTPVHVLITGGAGFIGSHSAEVLLAAGLPVRVLDNFSSGKLTNLPDHPALEIIAGDIRDPGVVEHVMRGISHVLHLAAQVSVPASIADPLQSGQTNVMGFLNVLDAARRNGVARFVYASSAAVYGVPSQLPLDEASSVAPLSPYGLEKSIDDQYAEMYHTLYGLSVFGLRYFNVYGPRQDPASPYSGVISRFSEALVNGKELHVYGDGKQTRDFIFVKDVAELNRRALEHTENGVCNLATGRSVTLLELIAALTQCAARPARVHHELPAAGDIRESSVSPAKMQELFGFPEMTPLSDGLKQLLEKQLLEVVR